MIGPKQVLERIVSDENFHGIAATSGHGAVTNVAGISSETPFPIHSVGKILSGVLMVEMVRQGIIAESDLTVPGIGLQPEIEKKLTRENTAVMERLSQVSILQAMQHTAGLASLNEKSGSKDCIDNYTKHLREGKETRRLMDDMVDFVGDKLTEIGPKKYSNDGLLLAGLALQNLYNSRTKQNLSYEEILNKLVIEPSRTNILMTRPVGVHYKEEDVEHLSKYPVTPAGGHFASTDDLLKLGEYLYQRCQDQEFMNGIKKYGGEFYDEDRNWLYHGGYMEGKTVEAKGSATEFAVSLNDGKTIVILMDRDASEDDRNSGRLTQTHARGFYKELRNSLEQERISSQTPQPKFPHNISVVDQVDSSSVGVDRDREFPIMSISKSFCGAVSALMAVDDKFGSNGIDATISEALTAAIQNYPGRQEIIEQYLQMLDDKGLGDIRLSELLTHRSGIIEAKSEPAAYKDRPVFEFISEKLSMGTGRGKGAYLNSGFTLMEEIINLTSDFGYENELKVRIFDKCELTKTGDLHKSEEALARVGQVVLAPGMKIPMKDEVSQTFQEYDFAENEPLGRVPLSAGGLSSTVNDMEKYSVELVKMIVGQPSALTVDLEEKKAQKIKEIYISSADKEMGGTAKEGDSYSFGVEMHVQKDGTFVVQHGGNFAANAGMMSVTASADRREFFSAISMNKSDYLTQSFVNEGSQTADIVLEYFNSKLSMEEQKQFSTMSAKENFLIQQRRLPIEFINSSADQPSLRDQIFAGFGGFRQEMSNHLIGAGYLNEDGVIDGVKVKNDFQNLQQSSTEIASTGRRAAEKVLAKSEDLLNSEKVENLTKKQQESWVQMTYINNSQKMEDPYYWRNKVMFWRAANEAYSRDSENSSDLTWAEVVGKEKLQDQGQNQSALSKLWYKEGMQIDLNSNSDMADSLKDIMKHIKDMATQVKKNGTSDIWQGAADDLVELRNDQDGLKLKALAVAALAEADGHAPEAKKILDQVGSEKRKKLKTDSKQIIKPISSQDSSR